MKMTILIDGRNDDKTAMVKMILVILMMTVIDGGMVVMITQPWCWYWYMIQF